MLATLYRCTTPTNWLCPCGRVERELRKAGVEHDTVRVALRRSRRPQVERLTGQQRVPVAVLGDEAICDSRRVVEHLRRRSARPAWRTRLKQGAAVVSRRARP